MNELREKPMYRHGRWTKEEVELFTFAFEWHKNNWKKLAEIITTRSIIQIRSHAQKYCNSAKEKLNCASQMPKIYVLDSGKEALHEYISNSYARSYKRLIEYQQNLMYASSTPTEIQCKVIESSLKTELIHN